MSTIKLHLIREKKFYGSMVPLTIHINGQEVAKIKNGESISLDIPNSRSVLKLNMAWNALVLHKTTKEAVLFTDYSYGTIECLICLKPNWMGVITNGLFETHGRIELNIRYK